MFVLVTGATGFIAGQLIPRLLAHGHQVRAMARDPHRLDQPWVGTIDVVAGDVMLPATLPAALHGVHTAYYLIHSMSSGCGYTARDLEGARNFAQAAATAGVQHIIYLGGLADPKQQIAPHMRSRVQTGLTLRQGPVPVTEFRASVIAGSGSTSFEMIRRITELFRIIPGPVWLRHRTQPIAAQNVVDYLLGALEQWDGQGRVIEIGGPEVTTYADLMLCYAGARRLKRSMVLIPGLPVWLMALGFRLLTSVPRATAAALIGGLRVDSVVVHDDAARFFPGVELIDFASVARATLNPLQLAPRDRALQTAMRWLNGFGHWILAAFGEALTVSRRAAAHLLEVPLLRPYGLAETR